MSRATRGRRQGEASPRIILSCWTHGWTLISPIGMRGEMFSLRKARISAFSEWHGIDFNCKELLKQQPGKSRGKGTKRMWWESEQCNFDWLFFSCKVTSLEINPTKQSKDSLLSKSGEIAIFIPKIFCWSSIKQHWRKSLNSVMMEVTSPKPLNPGLCCTGFVPPCWVRGAPGGVCSGQPEQRALPGSSSVGLAGAGTMLSRLPPCSPLDNWAEEEAWKRQESNHWARVLGQEGQHSFRRLKE